MIWEECSAHSEAWQAEQRRIVEEANQKRSDAAKVRPRTETGTLAAAYEPVQPQVVAGLDYNKTKTATAKAAASGTNRGTVERMDKLKRDRPDLAAKVKSGELAEAWQAEQRRIVEEANQKRSDAAKAQPRSADGNRLAEKQVCPQVVGTPEGDRSKTAKTKAAASGTNRGTGRGGDY